MNESTTENAVAITTPTLEQRVVKIKFYLNQTAQNIIEVGKELTAAKQEVPHGEWQAWLNDNFSLSYQTAAKFMQVAERFSNVALIRDFNSTQLITMLALPAADTEKFIAEKAAAGTPVEEMTIKTLREEVAKYKSDAEAEKAKVENQFSQIKNQASLIQQLQQDNGRLQAKFDSADKLANRYHVERDNLQRQLENQKPITVEPADYQQLRKSKVELQNKINQLQNQLKQKTIETVAPADYEDTKKELAELQKRYDEVSQNIDLAQKLDAISDLIRDIMTSQSENGVEEYAKTKPERFNDICANFADFLDFYDTERKKK